MDHFDEEFYLTRWDRLVRWMGSDWLATCVIILAVITVTFLLYNGLRFVFG